MRAGCFAETRVINLLNRRFINFYYHTDQGGPGVDKGGDAAAKGFTKGKTKNRWAFFAAFTAEGEPVGVTDTYADKDVTFDFLVALLRENPEFDKFTKQEEAILAKAKAEPTSVAAQLAAGTLFEELGRYKEATPYFLKVVERPETAKEASEAYRALLRMSRYSGNWDRLHELRAQINYLKPEVREKLMIDADVAMEFGFSLLATKKYDEARKVLQAAIKGYPESQRQSELHFYAGVASFFLKDKDRAYYHWCHVVETMPDDRLARRCYIAAAHEGMPYENPELGGYRASLPGGNIQIIQRAYDRAKAVYERMKEKQP